MIPAYGADAAGVPGQGPPPGGGTGQRLLSKIITLAPMPGPGRGLPPGAGTGQRLLSKIHNRGADAPGAWAGATPGTDTGKRLQSKIHNHGADVAGVPGRGPPRAPILASACSRRSTTMPPMPPGPGRRRASPLPMIPYLWRRCLRGTWAGATAGRRCRATPAVEDP